MSTSITEELKELEIKSAELEPNISEVKSLRTQVTNYTDNFIQNINSIKTFYTSKDKSKEIYDYPIGNPHKINDLLSLFERAVEKEGLNRKRDCRSSY